ncbi:MAG: HDOD domain-containing protein [Lachnospiraceae bacterium]|nr:HDOD domain-containing protein [Lachnospiraceae bacterium]
MLAVLVPLFDEKMAVKSYSLISRKKNIFSNPLLGSTEINDSIGQIDGLEIIDNVGMTTLSSDKEIFVPVNCISIFTDIASQCRAPHSRIVILMDNSLTPDEMYVKRIRELKDSGYKFAISKLKVSDFENYRPVLSLIDYIYLDYTKIDITKAQVYFMKCYPNIKLIAENIQSNEDYELLKSQGGYHFYEGSFYRLPVTKGDNEISPLKINYLSLLNEVNTPDFDLQSVADIISHDTALVLSLLEIVNRMSRNSKITSIRHAAAMLGQKELKKWITTAVAKELCSDKPSEITRLSLLRAKFAENLAPTFGLAMKADELFLMGLFSVLDIILSKPMDEALKTVNVSKEISQALLESKGDFYQIINFIRLYEGGDFNELNRLEIVDRIDVSDVYDAYKESLKWYRDLFY